MDEAKKSVLVKVDESELSKAIGRRGQNARLTARLTGWDVQVQKDESAHEAFEAQVAGASLRHRQGRRDRCGPGHPPRPWGGLTSLDMIANDVDEVDIADILDISIEEAREIRNRAITANGGVPATAAAEAPVEEAPAEPETASRRLSGRGPGRVSLIDNSFTQLLSNPFPTAAPRPPPDPFLCLPAKTAPPKTPGSLVNGVEVTRRAEGRGPQSL